MILEKFIKNTYNDICQFSFVFENFILKYSVISHKIYIFNEDFDFFGIINGPNTIQGWVDLQRNISFDFFQPVINNVKQKLVSEVL